MEFTTKLCVFIFVIATATAAAIGDPRRGVVRELVKRVDTSDDQFLSTDEIQTEYAAHDTDGDGILTQTEYVNHFIRINSRAPAFLARQIAGRIFEKLDKNSDNSLTQAEMWDPTLFDDNGRISVDDMTTRILTLMTGGNPMQQLQQAAMDKAVAVTDRNSDGIIDQTEFEAAAGRHDTNGDGEITKAEWVQGFVANNPQMGAMGAGMARCLFASIDTDNNQVLTRAEMVPDIADVDTNDDNEVSVAEFKAYMASTVQGLQCQPTLQQQQIENTID